MLKLYSYFRSSASFRVRIALHWKSLAFEYIPIHLRNGEQSQPQYLDVNPFAHVPTLVHGDVVLFESMAILQYLEDVFPERKLFPTRPADKAHVLQICESVNAGIQPLQNLKVQQYLEREQGFSKEKSDGFVVHWMSQGLEALEKTLKKTAGQHGFGDEFTAADCLLLPQCVTAERFHIALENYPALKRVYENGMKIPAAMRAHPRHQPDFQA